VTGLFTKRPLPQVRLETCDDETEGLKLGGDGIFDYVSNKAGHGKFHYFADRQLGGNGILISEGVF
jgi:hypothetical protein